MRRRGFTLVELVMVLVIVGVLAVFAAPRFMERSTYSSLGFYDQTKSTIRYAQKLAVAQNRPVYVRLNGSSVALCFDQACASKVQRPSGKSDVSAACDNDQNWFCEAPPSGISYSSPVPLFFFSAQGRPFNPGDGVLTSTFSARLLITITTSGESTPRTLIVEQETGYVHS